MCLTVNSLVPKRIKFVNGRATVYKCFMRDNNSLRSPLFSNFKFQPGSNVAKGRSRKTYRKWQSIHGGAIHCCVSKRSILEMWNSRSNDYVIVPLTVFQSDFIAEGINGDAAFKKVFIKKADYEKAVNPKTSKRALLK